VKDTTGAGDAFTGAFLAEWVSAQNLQHALKAGCVAGACSCSEVGGSTCPSNEKLQNINSLL
jgi:sugar/nucleoside kinase (ribokinase family)